MELMFRKHYGGWFKQLWEGGPYDEVMLRFDDQRYLLVARDGRIDMMPRLVFSSDWDTMDVSDLDRDTVWLATLFENGGQKKLCALLAELLGVKLFWKDPNSLYKALTQ